MDDGGTHTTVAKTSSQKYSSHICRDPTQPAELLSTGGYIFKTTVAFGII